MAKRIPLTEKQQKLLNSAYAEKAKIEKANEEITQRLMELIDIVLDANGIDSNDVDRVNLEGKTLLCQLKGNPANGPEPMADIEKLPEPSAID